MSTEPEANLPSTPPDSPAEAVAPGEAAKAGGDASTGAPASSAAPSSSPAEPVDTRNEELARMREQLLRTAADFDNYRKRSRREIDDAQRRGGEEMLRELLPVFDNLERAAQSAGQAADVKAVADGVRMVLRQFLDTLVKAGIRRVPTVGTPFDPAIHEAIQQVETAEHPAGTVVAEVQPGYAFGDKLIRAAMVVVAKPPPAANGAPEPKIEPS
jgi:molecular chaperone GrpE